MPPTWKAVYEAVKRVPKGRVITYGSLARAAKLRGGAREAGHAMGACPRGSGIPWHRVVGAGGRLLIREPLASLQKRMLEGEGTRFAGARVDMATHEWFPPGSRKRPKRERSKRKHRARGQSRAK
jgi:methylated-DNA-protein-cysteine methyltransferase-like protein